MICEKMRCGVLLCPIFSPKMARYQVSFGWLATEFLSRCTIPLTGEGGGNFVEAKFGNLEIPELQLPHAHPHVEAHAPFRVRTICKSNCH